MNIESDPELQCPICKRVGQNMVEEEEWVIGDEVKGKVKWIVCKCGHAIKEIDSDDGDIEYEGY